MTAKKYSGSNASLLSPSRRQQPDPLLALQAAKQHRQPPQVYLAGLDVGSTTAKLVILDSSGNLCVQHYCRHGSNVLGVLPKIFGEVAARISDVPISITVTGSAGIGIAESCEIPFIQEVNASIDVARRFFPQASTLIDIGGEDSKIVFFSPERPPDIRMNGSCAGGTGAFIDQMAELLGVSPERLDALAGEARRIHPIASRCGVFAKTDIQNLLSRKIDLPDICASILHAVILQNLATLAHGMAVRPPILLSGGPFSFLTNLRQALRRILKLAESDVLTPKFGQYLPAWGAALASGKSKSADTLQRWCERMCSPAACNVAPTSQRKRLPALFDDQKEFLAWKSQRAVADIPSVPLQLAAPPLFLGIDSGSTTTKLLALDAVGKMVFGAYRPNLGAPLETVGAVLRELRSACAGMPLPRIGAAAVTGYGEDLIRAAFNLRLGIVETFAHWRGAMLLDPDVSFILDIGGQDMKAIFVNERSIQRIEINEACSSGCGSFIEGFAQTLGLSAEEFSQKACMSREPCDLGTRCTVFMNSRIKQAQREKAAIEDIAAGLAYAVIKNALYKVLKLRDPKELGGHIVVQGGAFRNLAVVRALELLTGQTVSSPSRPELMGAYGAALLAREQYERNGGGDMMDLNRLCSQDGRRMQTLHCNGCANQCSVTEFRFHDGHKYFIGNKCERIFVNRGEEKTAGVNIFTLRNRNVFL
jgi:predicted CoA-substrate-specific enzyme activase